MNPIILRARLALYDTIGTMRRRRWEAAQPKKHRRHYSTMSRAEYQNNRGL